MSDNLWNNGYETNRMVSVAKDVHTLVSRMKLHLCSSGSWMLTKKYGAVYAFTLAMLGVLIYELVYNAKEQGNPFSFKVGASNGHLFSSGFGCSSTSL